MSSETTVPSTASSAGNGELVVARDVFDWLGRRLEAGGLWFSIKSLSDGRLVLLSPELAAWLGPASADAEQAPQTRIAASLVARAHAAAERGALTVPQGFNLRQAIELPAGRLEYDITAEVLRDAAGEPLWLCTLWQEVSRRERAEAQLQSVLAQLEEQQKRNEKLRRDVLEQGVRDASSGLHSRAHFEEQLRREADLSQREHREFALVLIALDAPKPALAPRPPAVLDRLRESLGGLLRGGTRAMDASCRWDGDRFGVLLSGVGLATAHSRMEGLRRQCATQIVAHEGREERFTVSMGIASYPHTADGLEDLLRAGEGALAEAQHRGGNQVTLASIRLAGA